MPQQPTYDFYHDKLRALVYEEISLARRRLLHRRVAEALIKRARTSTERGGLAGLIAYHYRMAGQDAAAAEYFTLAGEHARRIYAERRRARVFESALALGHPDVAALHEAIGDLSTLLGEYRAAMQSYETAAASYKMRRLRVSSASSPTSTAVGVNGSRPRAILKRRSTRLAITARWANGLGYTLPGA